MKLHIDLQQFLIASDIWPTPEIVATQKSKESREVIAYIASALKREYLLALLWWATYLHQLQSGQ